MRYSAIRRSVRVAAVGTLLFGCGDGPTDPVIPDYHHLPTTNLPAAMLLDVPLREGFGAFCWIQAPSMILAYLDPSSTEAEVFTYAGLGAVLTWAPPWAGLKGALTFGPERWGAEAHVLTLLQSYGANHVIGYAGPDVNWNPSGLQHLRQAGPVGKIEFRNADEALTHLKAAVASGRPVNVHVGAGQLITQCRLMHFRPEECKVFPGGSHHMVVTGYDETSIYVNDTPTAAAYWNDPDHPHDPRDPRLKDMRIPVDEFMRAWQEPREWGGSAWFYMFFIEQTTGSQLNKTSVAQILAMQKELSRDVVQTIDAHAAEDLTYSNWGGIAATRRLFGHYLSAHGYPEAGALYRSMADDYERGWGMSAADARTLLLTVIRPKEVEVRSKY